jgi:hypothetical protein
VLWRTGYALRQHSGLLRRRFPAVPLADVRWSDLVDEKVPPAPDDYRAYRESSPTRFFFPAGRPPDAATLKQVVLPSGHDRIVAVADDYARGCFLYYSRQTRDLGWPVNWLLNPFTGATHNVQTHWCDYPTFSPAAGDIKDVWEPSRFACAFWLVRAYALTGDEKYSRGFWELFESWCVQNPPNRGPNWKCGQETALRTLAWCFALYGLWNSPETTAQRVVALVKMLAIQADRIVNNIGYAVSQKNNHAISEAAGLLTTALLFPELQGAARWGAVGRRVLEREIRRQIYVDGSYVQHSMNYHRVLLHDALWALRLAELNGQPLSSEAKDRVSLAGEFLLQMLDPDSGGVPNYGANDGALVLPLSSCEYGDYRPTVQAGCYQATGRRVLPDGPWNEALLWLFGPFALAGEESAPRLTSRRFDAGGYYTLRGRDTWCMVRCHTYRDRPAHVDLLHLDLWYKGVNVLGDSGTYKYYVPDHPALEHYFKGMAAHNTIEVDHREPLELVSRFLWVPWPAGTCLRHEPDRWTGEHYAYRRSPWYVVHRRSIHLVNEHAWRIEDELSGRDSHAVTARWHLADRPWRLDADRRMLELDLPGAGVTLSVQGPEGLRLEVHRGLRDGRLSGWSAPTYGVCTPRPTLEVTGRWLLPVRLTTTIQIRENSSLPADGTGSDRDSAEVHG